MRPPLISASPSARSRPGAKRPWCRELESADKAHGARGHFPCQLPKSTTEKPPRMRQDPNRTIEEGLGKVPEVTLWFWIIKIAATTLGETGGDAVTMSMNLGYLVGTVIFAALFVIAVAAQIRARRFHPFLFW